MVDKEGGALLSGEVFSNLVAGFFNLREQRFEVRLVVKAVFLVYLQQRLIDVLGDDGRVFAAHPRVWVGYAVGTFDGFDAFGRVDDDGMRSVCFQSFHPSLLKPDATHLYIEVAMR